MEMYVPKFILQPLVENSIVHGIEAKPGKGLVRIGACMEGATLVLEVTDNGIGMDSATVHRLLDGAADDIPQKHNHTNVGLISVHKRLQILYGQDYGIAIHSEPGEGTTIYIRLPSSMPGGFAAPQHRSAPIHAGGMHHEQNRSRD